MRNLRTQRRLASEKRKKRKNRIMANLAMAVPSMQSGDPQGSSGNAIVTEKSFVNFANSFDKLSPKHDMILGLHEI